MLSIERCRAVLGKAAAGMSDAEVERGRDQLYVLAGVALRMFHASRRPGQGGQAKENAQECVDKAGEGDIMEQQTVYQ